MHFGRPYSLRTRKLAKKPIITQGVSAARATRAQDVNRVHTLVAKPVASVTEVDPSW